MKGISLQDPRRQTLAAAAFLILFCFYLFYYNVDRILFRYGNYLDLCLSVNVLRSYHSRCDFQVPHIRVCLTANAYSFNLPLICDDFPPRPSPARIRQIRRDTSLHHRLRSARYQYHISSQICSVDGDRLKQIDCFAKSRRYTSPLHGGTFRCKLHNQEIVCRLNLPPTSLSGPFFNRGIQHIVSGCSARS